MDRLNNVANEPNYNHQNLRIKGLSRISISLLGPPRIERDGEPITIDRHKAIALLAFLVVTAKTHRRDALADLLWSELDQARSRSAVRRVLASLTKAIPGPWWETDRETIGFNHRIEPSIWLDVDHFQAQLAECGTHGHSTADVCSRCLDPLADAVSLYRADFLHGFSLRDSQEFDDWQLDQTERLRRDLAAALERIARLSAAQGMFEPAIRYSRRWLSLDPLNELAHRQLMRIFAGAGERHAALRQYAECVRILERELGVTPEEETSRLYEAIKADQLVQSIDDGFPFSQNLESLRKISRRPILAPPAFRPAPPFERLARGGLIGRAEELERARMVLAAVSANKARGILIGGEPGIGKSRLAREIVMLAERNGSTVLEGRCNQVDQAPYEPIAQVVRSVISPREALLLSSPVLADVLLLTPDLASDFAAHPGKKFLDPGSAQRRFFESIATFLASIVKAKRTPLVLFIEDIHWADSGTLNFLLHLTRQAAAQKIQLLLLLTYRDAEADLDDAFGLRDFLLELNREGGVATLRLSRLDRDETREMLMALLGGEGEISAEFSNAIFSETEGHPFFIEESCRALIDAGNLYFSGGRWKRAESGAIPLPKTVRSAILSRLEKLPPDVREMLNLAAIIGREFDPETLRIASEKPYAAVSGGLVRAERAQLLLKVERAENLTIYSFAHALIPLALRERIDGLSRQRMHGRVAEALERRRPDDVEALAYHFIAAGAHARAVEYSRKSAMRAERLYAYQAAITHLQSAIELQDAREDVDSRISLLEQLADLHHRINESAQAIPIYLEALQLRRGQADADPWIAVRLQRKIGETVTGMNRFADYQRFAATGRSSLEGALALVQDRPPHPETVRLFRTLSFDSWYVAASADWEAADRFAQSAVALAEKLESPEVLSAALEALAIVRSARGEYRENVEVCLRRLALSRDPRFRDDRERVNIQYQLGRAFLAVGEYETAIGHAQEAERLSAVIRDIAMQVNAMTLQSQCLYPLDRWDELLAIDEKLQAMQTNNAFERLGIAMCFHTALHSAVQTLRGEPEQAIALREESYGIMIELAGPPGGWSRNQYY